MDKRIIIDNAHKKYEIQECEDLYRNPSSGFCRLTQKMQHNLDHVVKFYLPKNKKLSEMQFNLLMNLLEQQNTHIRQCRICKEAENYHNRWYERRVSKF